MAFLTRNSKLKLPARKWPPSLTQPDEALTIEQLYARYVSGQSLGGDNSMYVTSTEEPTVDDYDFSEIQRMDILERNEVLEHLRASNEAAKDKIRRDAGRRQKAKRDKAHADAVAAAAAKIISATQT